MKREKLQELRASKPFEIGDVLVYSALFFIVIVLFIFFVITPTTIKSNGFNLFLDGKKIAVFKYEYGLEIVDEDYIDFLVYDENNCTLTVYVDNQKSQFNVVSIDKNKKTAKVTDANCSESKDCVHTPSLGVAIVCAPHKLKLTPIDDEGFTPPITGGLR